MKNIEILYWAILGLIFYTYLGYGMLLYVTVLTKRLFVGKPSEPSTEFEPEVTLFIPCYNEKDILERKLRNTRELDYPKSKLKVLFVTDGSTDGSAEYLHDVEGVDVLHKDGRAGKIGAMNRGMREVDTDYVIFSDANTDLNSAAIRNIVRHFANEKVGCVAGEKRIIQNEKDNASASGEGLYWKYESSLKVLDSELTTAIGAAGELFALRSKLFEEMESDTLLDDFMLSLRIVQQGYKTVYEKEAYAQETASANVTEELKRKVRICAGGIQSILRLKPLLNPFKYGIISWQYISHRVLRWTITPFLFISFFNLNIFIAVSGQFHITYDYLLFAQIGLYALAIYGFFQKDVKTKSKLVFVPFYFFMMNYAVLQGIKRYFAGSQSVLWEKAKRA